jgi:hypothetical protein
VSVILLSVVEDTEGLDWWGASDAKYVYLKTQMNDGEVVYVRMGIGGQDGCTREEDRLNRAKACVFSKQIGQNVTIYPIYDY